jgi:transcription initiation factor IIE alpha subunit
MSEQLTIDRYVVHTLMRDLVAHDHRPSAFIVYMALLELAASGRATPSHAQLADLCGLSKRAVQDALRHLAGRQLISIERRGRTEPAIVRPLAPWRGREVQANS